jgi:hypothetical protein
VEFVRGEKRISIALKKAVLIDLDKMNFSQIEGVNEDILQKSDEELFLVKRS